MNGMLALLWDMNGVLVDDEPIQERVWRAVLADAGFELETSSWRAHCMGRKIVPALQRLFPALDDRAIGLLAAEKQRRYRHLAAGGLPLVAGASELIALAAARSVPQAVVTSASAVEIALVLEQLQAHSYFDVLVCGADVSADKPAPDCYLLASARLGVNPQDCWVIEDSLFGIEAAQAAGMRVIAVTTSLAAAELEHADMVVDGFDVGLLATLQALAG